MEERRVQCGLIGDAFIGKTTFAQTLKKETIYYENHYHPTIGVDLVVCQLDIDEIPYNIIMWDLTGGKRFRAIITSYFMNCILDVIY